MEIIKISPFEQPQTVQAVASVYQQSFGGEPWNEGYLCPVCESVFARTFDPTSDLKTCPACSKQSKSALLVEYWPISKIVSDFYREMKKPDPLCVVAQSDGEVIGFAWGYRVSAVPELDLHLDAPDLHRSLQGDFFYLDECALAPSHQGRGIGKLLVNQICREQQQGKVLLRTMDDSRMCRLIKHGGGETIQHISRGRIIMRSYTP